MIKKIYINSFGKFNNYSLDLDRGINLILGQNEAGKTTLINFIFMVLYGSQSRSSDLLQNDRKRYQAWDGSQMKGHLVISKEGVDYRIERTFMASNSTDIVKVFNNHTGQEIPIAEEKEPGRHFFQMGPDAFKKTLFLSSEDLVIANDSNRDELTRKLVNLVTTGEEDVSYKAVLANLDKKIETMRSRSGKKGTLVEKEEDEKRLYLEIEEAKADEREKDLIAEKISNLEEKVLEKKGRINSLHTAISKKKDRDKMEVNKRELKYKLGIQDRSDDLVRFEDIKDELDSIKARNPIFTFNPLDLSLVFVGLFLALSYINRMIFFLMAGVFFLVFIYSQVLKIKEKDRKIRKLSMQAEDLEKSLGKYKKDRDFLTSEIYYIDKAIDEINYDIRDLDVFDADLAYEKLEEEKDVLHKLNEEIAAIKAGANEKFRGKENLSTLEIKLDGVKKDLDDMREHLRVLNMTRDLVVKSFGQVEVDFSKRISDKASDIIERITGGAYSKILVSNDFDIKVEDRNTGDLKEWKYVSAGTIDQFYLALRLAIIELVVENKEDRILLLDDLFMRFDLGRQGNTLRVFEDLSARYEQMLIFANKKPSGLGEYRLIEI